MPGACYDPADDEYAWPLGGVNFNVFHYVTGPIQREGRAALTVWQHIQGQRKPERVGTFLEWLQQQRR